MHLLYDPDFKDENDFRYDLRKLAMSPGPGAHQDPLKSFKAVIHKNGNFSIPKVRLCATSFLGEETRLPG